MYAQLYSPLIMTEGYRYIPQTKVEWTSSDAYAQFRLWRKEVERIINGPMHGDDESVKLNTVYIWAGAHAGTLVEARIAEDSTRQIETTSQLLDCLAQCLTHSTFFREAREDFYNIKQFQVRIPLLSTVESELFRLAEFPTNSEFLIVDKLIHGCINSECKRKLMTKGKNVTVKQCLEVLRQHEAIDVTMKHFGDASQINASYIHDPTKRSQKNGHKGKKKVSMSQSLSDTPTPAKNSVRGAMLNNICMFSILLRARHAISARRGVILKGPAV